MDYGELIKKIPVLGFMVKWLGGEGIDYGWLLSLTAMVMFIYGLGFTNISQQQVFAITIALSPLWITYFVGKSLFYEKWMEYIGKKFARSQGRTTLRIKLPPEVFKSPEAMEFVISQIHGTQNPDNLWQTYIDGKRPLNNSFEIVSIGGDVRFYANVPTKKIKPALEANLYAQYPGVEVIEEPVDYAAEIPTGGGGEWDVMSFHMGKKKEQEKPIRTYIDYGMDKLPKEEEKIDPITPTLEVLSSIGPDERIYIQYIAKPFRTSSFKNGQLMRGEGESWEKGVMRMINEIMKRDDKGNPLVGEEREEVARLTAGERDMIAAMERNAGKYAYDVGIRWMYIARKGKFNADNISGVIRTFSQFDIIGRQQIGVRWRTDANYKDWVPGVKKKILAWKTQEHKEYKSRLYFNKSGADSMKIFTAEELATVWHLPGKVAVTPALGRIESARAEAPSNLPTGI
jgi:hypothetical protein